MKDRPPRQGGVLGVIMQEFHHFKTKRLVGPFEFDFSFGRSDESLKKSIADFGVLQPIHLWESENGFVLLDGHKRVGVAQKLGLDEIPTLLYQDLDDSAAFWLALELRGPLNWVEKGRILKKATEFLSDEEISTRLNSFLELNEVQAKSILKALLLDEVVLQDLVKKNWPIHAATKLSELFKATEATFLYHFLQKFNLNQNKFVQCVEWINDILKRDGVTLADWVQKFESQLSINLEAPNVSDLFKNTIEQLRYPQFSKAKLSFADKLKKIKTPSFVKIAPPALFEKEGLELTVKLSTEQELNLFLQWMENQQFSEFFE